MKFVKVAFRVVMALTALLGPTLLKAEAVAQPSFGDGFGVNIKIEDITDSELAEIAQLGIRDVRTAMGWYIVEQKLGVYNWSVSLPRNGKTDNFQKISHFTYDQMFQTIHEHGLHILVTITGGNQLYAPVIAGTSPEARPVPLSPPQTLREIEGFSAFAAASAAHYQHLLGSDAITWSIWNEPDADTNIPRQTSAAIVGELITNSCRAIKRAVPAAKVIAPSLAVESNGRFRYRFIEELFQKTNPLTCLDAFSIHPYSPFPPESRATTFKEMQNFLSKWQPTAPVPVVADEWGVTTTHASPLNPLKWWRNYSDDEQAALQLRIYLTDLMLHIPYTILYEWRDSGEDPQNGEHHYGMKYFDGRNKPAIKMLKYVWGHMMGRKLQGNIAVTACPADVHLLQFGPSSRDDHLIVIAWQESDQNLTLNGTFKDVRDIFGNKIDAHSDDYKLSGIPLLLDVGTAVPSLFCH